MRGIRGAITVKANEKKQILKNTKLLIKKIIDENNIKNEEIVSIIFTATSDLDKEYPAVAARKLGFVQIPLMCCQEMFVKDSLEKCIRILMHINRDCNLEEINHIYLKKAKKLRPDLINHD